MENIVLRPIFSTCFLADSLGYEQESDKRVGIKVVKRFCEETI